MAYCRIGPPAGDFRVLRFEQRAEQHFGQDVAVRGENKRIGADTIKFLRGKRCELQTVQAVEDEAKSLRGSKLCRAITPVQTREEADIKKDRAMAQQGWG